MRNPSSFSRRTALAACALLAAGATLAAEDAAKFPERPVRVIVPYAAGGTSDVLARLVAQKLSERWGQQVVIENRAGGGTVIGASAVARAAPDGHTLLLTNNTHFINPHLMANLPYDAMRDFTPVSTLATSAYLLLLKPSVPAQNLQEFLAYVKAHPGKVNFGTHGPGGLTHLAAELLNMTAGTRMQMVQYKGAGPALTGILAGEVDVYLDAPATTVPHVKSGKLRAIGISGKTRLASLPDVPPISEAGVPGFDVTIWYGLLGPANLPAAVTRKINTDLAAVLALPEVKNKLEGLGVTPFASSQTDFVRFVQAEQDKYGRIVKAADIKAN